MSEGSHRKLTYANVTATLALLISLSGGAAATHLVVNSSDIQNNQVKSVDVRDDALSGGGLTGQDILESTLGRVPDAGKLDGRDASEFATRQESAWTDAIAAPQETQCEPGYFCSQYSAFTNPPVWLRWGNYGDGYPNVGWHKDDFGVVHLKGIGKAFVAGAAPGRNILRLPTGFRPSGIRIFTVAASDLEWDVVPARVDVHPDGIVQIVEACNDQVTNVCSGDGWGYISFDGISFRTDS